jgi:hypothetical protein
MPDEKELQTIKQLLDLAENNLRQAKSILFSKEYAKKAEELKSNEDNQVVEGVFDGEKMVAQNKKTYLVPSNYASKSKLVAGDILKLTILDDGSYLFKQIGPVARKKLTGTLKEVADGKFVVVCGSVEYRVLPASVTYFKIKVDDKLTILVPEDAESVWGAVENII